MNAHSSFPIDADNAAQLFDQLRLSVLDAFNDLDQALEEWIHEAGASAPGASTGCRLDKLLTLKNLSSKQAERVKALRRDLSEPIQIRNAVVHSRASFGTVDDAPAIFLKMIGYRHGHSELYFHATFGSIARTIDTARSIARQLDGWREQRAKNVAAVAAKASSPPPPSPDGAGGP